ncbi:MAG: UDP-N-acetylmuramate dehydrogenase [Oscillospiraceae bacterium]|nr:UDP-N-acetylmuramate dehydrogenase [Oscillospiraceae bacterium]
MSQNSDILRYFREKLPELQINEQVSMKERTSFRIGGPCDVMLLPKSAAELRAAWLALRELGVRPLVLGACTNVLIPDEGLRGVVIETRDGLGALRQVDDTHIEAECGATLAKLSLLAASLDLAGLEFAQGIPGSVGGGVYMNAGAYGGEIRQTAEKTATLTGDGTPRDYVGGEQGFHYRGSAFQNMDGMILSTVFALQKGSHEEIRAKMQDFSQRRREKQPLELPSAGSAFKRPEGHYAAALIEEAGLKGFRVGGAAVSEKHAGFLVNLGGATAKDVLSLVEQVQKRVLETSGVELEPEIRLFRG